jgi:hypothetical protein
MITTLCNLVNYENLLTFFTLQPYSISLEFPKMSVFGAISKFCKGIPTFRQNSVPPGGFGRPQPRDLDENLVRRLLENP